jgi:proline dehydrogenase
MNALNKLVAATLPAVPKPIVRQVAGRYIAGEHLTDAVRTVRQLNAAGMCATLDVLGEDISRKEEAIASREESIETLRTIAREQLDANLSIKLTSLGLKLDKQFCEDNVRRIISVAAELRTFVRIDMEDSSCTTDTIDIYRTMHKTFTNVGIVVQAYLRRTREDVEQLIGEKADFRLCKGIYREPEEIAFREYEEINDSFRILLHLMLSGGVRVGIATHDTPLVTAAYEMIRNMNLQRHQYEFQMLLGVRPELRDRIVRDGHPMRVYVPYGSHWYGYSLRRFKENPQLAGYVFKALFTREG